MNLFCETLSNLFVHCIAQVGHSPLDQVGMPGNFAVANTISHGGNKRIHIVAQFNKCSRTLVRCSRFVERNEKRCNAFGLALHNFRIQAFHVVEVLKHGAHRNLGPLGCAAHGPAHAVKVIVILPLGQRHVALVDHMHPHIFHHHIAGLFQHLGDDLLRTTVAIDVRRIDKGHARIECRVERRAAVGLRHFAPGSADLPGAAGLGRTFQNLQIFFNMSALDNVMVGAFNRVADVAAGGPVYVLGRYDGAAGSFHCVWTIDAGGTVTVRPHRAGCRNRACRPDAQPVSETGSPACWLSSSSSA